MEDVLFELKELKKEVRHIQSLINSKKCQFCEMPVVSTYLICPKHYVCGWSSDTLVEVKNKGQIPSDEVVAGDEVLSLINETGHSIYATVTEVFIMDNAECCDVLNNEIRYSDGIQVVDTDRVERLCNTFDSKTTTLETIVNFKLDRIRTVILFNSNDSMLFVKTY